MLFRIYVVWRNILNFSTEQPSCTFCYCHFNKTSQRHYLFISALSWNSLLIYIRNLKKSSSNEVVKENSSDKNSLRASEIITDGKQKTSVNPIWWFPLQGNPDHYHYTRLQMITITIKVRRPQSQSQHPQRFSSHHAALKRLSYFKLWIFNGNSLNF